MKRIIKISLFLVFFSIYFFMLTNCNEKKSPKLKFILPLLASTNQSASSLINLVPSTENLGGVSGADNSCNSDANKPNDGSHCTQWGNTGSSGVVGNGNQTNNNAINLNSPSCSGVQNLLCAEQ